MLSNSNLTTRNIPQRPLHSTLIIQLPRRSLEILPRASLRERIPRHLQYDLARANHLSDRELPFVNGPSNMKGTLGAAF